MGFAAPGILALTLAVRPMSAQYADQGTLLIRAAGREVGTETFKITLDSASMRITGRSVYGTGASADMTVTVDRGREGELGFQLDRRGGPRGAQIYAVQKRNRITVRRVERGAEQASELPGGPRTALLADSVFSTFYQLVALARETGPVNVVFPQGTRRLSVTLERVAAGSGALVRFRGGLEGEIEVGNRGQVLRIQLPSLGLEAIRKPD